MMRTKLIFLVLLVSTFMSAQKDTVFVKAGQEIIIIGAESAFDDKDQNETRFYINVLNNIDHHPNVRGKGARYFWNVSHDLPYKGIFNDGGVSPSSQNFEAIQNNCIGVNYNGSMCDNALRVKKLKDQFDVVCVVPQEIIGPFGNWLQWPHKYTPMWRWGETPGLQYAKIRQHFLALLWSTEGYVDFIQIANEPWGMTADQYNIVESARVDAWIEYNILKGRKLDDHQSFTPKLITAAMPIGQGLQTELSFQNLASSRFAQYYHSIAVHGYNRTMMSEWSTDASITNDIIDLALEFCETYMPHCQLQITETGAPNEFIEQHIEALTAKSKIEPGIYAIWLYNLFSDSSSIFKDCFFMYSDGTLTETAIKYNLITNER